MHHDGDRIALLAAQASDSRVERPEIAAELAASAVELARRTVSELLAHTLGRAFSIPASAREGDASAEGPREYTIRRISWREGPRFARRQSRTCFADVLIREHDPLNWTVFWDPRAPDTSWDTTTPPKLPNLKGMFWHKCQFATADELAQFACDAEVLLRGVLERELARTEMYRSGAARADAALGLAGPDRTPGASSRLVSRT